MNLLNILPDLKQNSDPDSILLGKIKGSIMRKERLTQSELNHHVHIVGASGFGKTVLLSHIVKDRIEKNKGLLFIDLKGDIDTIHKFLCYARSANRSEDVQVFSISDSKFSSKYNLIEEGTATQLRDKIMLSLNWSEEFYKNQAASYLIKLLIGLTWLRDNLELPFNIGTIWSAVKKL